MECSVEHSHLWQARHEFRYGVDTLHIGGVVERSQVADSLESLDDLRRDDDRLGKLLAAVHHAVTHCVNLVKALDDADLRVGEQ